MRRGKASGFMIFCSMRPERDTVLYDGECNFCRGQIRLLRRLDPCGRLTFRSLHEPQVASDLPEISREQLLSQMYVVDRNGRARGGAEAVRYISRRLPLLWPLAALLHIPGSLPLWRSCYAFVARNRYRIAGRFGADACDSGTCKLPWKT